MPCSSLVSLRESIPNAQTFAKEKHSIEPRVQVCSWHTHRAHVLDNALLLLLNHPVWVLSVNQRFPAGAGRCCFPAEELTVPRARECWCSWMGPQRFQHSVSPGLQSWHLLLPIVCVEGDFSTSVNLF